MSTSTPDLASVRARGINISEDTLTAELSDGRSISVPLAWFPRLQHGQPGERINWRLVGGGEGVHWPALDEDISVANLLAGKRSGESPASFNQWLRGRGAKTP